MRGDFGHPRPGFAARSGRKPAHGVRPDPEKAWRGLIEACARRAGTEDLQGPGLTAAITAARRVCAGVGFPVEGEDAKAAALALSELARTFPLAGEARRGWHGAAMLACAQHCEAMLDQARNGVLAGFRGGTGVD